MEQMNEVFFVVVFLEKEEWSIGRAEPEKENKLRGLSCQLVGRARWADITGGLGELWM